MLLLFAVIIVPALAAFSFQLICYANYQKNQENYSLKWRQQPALQNG